ncbi:MAG: DNA primase [Cycloclasticus sp. symbiont of Poecilosclerida sp. N]|nr:MAG: DNA primase [Cycloclasticus sp. symbiont of Poecilosclerida sp. N]
MAGRIPRNFIDDLLARTDVVDVIDSLLPLKKKGANYSACCPFHNEKTPSFTVSQDKQFYHCFGCGVSGSAINFLMDYSHLDFVEAIEELASRAGVEVVREQGFEPDKPKRDLTPLLQMNENVNAFYQEQLKQHATADRAKKYLKNRGLTGEVAKVFQLGFAPSGWDNLLSSLGQDKESLDVLRELGLLITNENNRTYDRFRERIMFPIRNKRGQTIGFGGRILDSGEPKYLNSPETPLYHKGREVYGLHEALKSSSKIQHIVLVEGYLDVISLYQQGICNTVAALGTAITREHIDLLFRSVSELIICMDGDSAGQKAAWRAMTNALPALRRGRTIRVLVLEQGEDPDSVIREKGAAHFERLIDGATPLSTYFFDYLEAQCSLDSIEGRASYMEQAGPLLATLPKGHFETLMKKRLAELTKISSPRVNVAAQARFGSRQVTRRPTKKLPSAVRYLIKVLLHEPAFAKKIETDDTWLTLDLRGMDVLKQVLSIADENQALSSGMLLERFRGDVNEGAVKALFLEEKLVAGDAFEQEFLDAIECLKEQSREKRREELLKKAANWSDEETSEYRKLIKYKQEVRE